MIRTGPGSVFLEGVGVHTGMPCRVEFRQRAEGGGGGGGIRFFVPGPVGPLEPGDFARSGRRAAYSTVLEGDGWSIRTPEHLLAALLFFSDCPLDVLWDGPELPILDGSALPFRDALGRLFPESVRRPAWSEYEADLEWTEEWEGGSLRVRPAETFSVLYAVERGPLREKAFLRGPAGAWQEVLPARTFLFHAEWARLSGKGAGKDAGKGAGKGGDAADAGEALLRGARLDSGLLVAETPELHARIRSEHPEWPGGPFPLLNQPAWRMSGEAAQHKVLDLLGDLALLGLRLPKCALEIRNGGHAVHHRLVERLAPFVLPGFDESGGRN